MKKLHTKQQLFFGVFKTFKEYEEYMERIEEPTLDFVDTMIFLDKTDMFLLATDEVKYIRKN